MSNTSSTQSKQAPQAFTQAPALQNMVLMVRGSLQGLYSFTCFILHEKDAQAQMGNNYLTWK